MSTPQQTSFQKPNSRSNLSSSKKLKISPQFSYSSTSVKDRQDLKMKTISPMSKPPLLTPKQFGYTLPVNIASLKDFNNSRFAFLNTTDDPETIRGSKEWVAAHRRDPNNLENRILVLLNLYRSQNQLPPLSFSRHLSDIVAFHNQKIIDGSIPPSSAGLKDRVRQVDGIISYAENIGTCCACARDGGFSLHKNKKMETPDPAKEIVDSWIQSPIYKKNILGRFNKVGIAIGKGKSQWYASVFFGLVY